MRRLMILAMPLMLLAQVAQAEDCERTWLIDRATALAKGEIAGEARTTHNGDVVDASAVWAAGAKDVHIHNAYADAGAGQVMVVGTGTGAVEQLLVRARRTLRAALATEMEV